jgi:hypothetical protein
MQLIGSVVLVTTIDLRHEKYLVSVTVLGERIAHPSFTAPLVVIPAVIHECDAPINRLINKPGSCSLGKRRLANMRAAKSDGRYGLSGATEFSIQHFAAQFSGIRDAGDRPWGMAALADR